jgi:hypothetical protein
MNHDNTPWQNGLLASLPAHERQRWEAMLEPTDLPLGKVL